MEVSLLTGTTRAAKGTSLVALSLKSTKNENVCALFQVKAEPEEARTFEKEVGTILEHALLETEGGSGERLDGALKELNGLFKGLMLTKAIEDVHAVVAIEDTSGALSVSHAGTAEAYIVRGGAASQITEYARGKATPAFVHIASGTLEPRDIVVFSTQRLLRTVTPAQLAQLAQRGEQVLDALTADLEAEKEQAALGVLTVSGRSVQMSSDEPVAPLRAVRKRDRRGAKFAALSAWFSNVKIPRSPKFADTAKRAGGFLGDQANRFFRDMRDPKRKRRAHLLLLAGTVAVFLIVWAGVNLTMSTERSKTRAELKELMEQIDAELKTADNRRLAGDGDAANSILLKAEEEATQVLNNESRLYRVEASDLLDRIRAKREEINNIIRVPPRLVVNAAAENPNVALQGLIGIKDGEFLLYDRQDLYRVLLNSIEKPDRLGDEELIVDAANFERHQTTVFQMTDNSLIELIGGQPTLMKTEDAAGWISGRDIETYLRFLYLLSPENNQIYKYERLSNRYGPPAQYNVDGALEGALDMAIDGNVWVLKDKGEIVKLFRGEAKPFVIRHAPKGALTNTAKIFKVPEGNIYVLDPAGARVVVVSDGGATGEASYLKQFILEGEQIGELKDLYVDPEEMRLYVMDEKRLYAVDLTGK